MKCKPHPLVIYACHIIAIATIVVCISCQSLSKTSSYANQEDSNHSSLSTYQLETYLPLLKDNKVNLMGNQTTVTSAHLEHLGYLPTVSRC